MSHIYYSSLPEAHIQSWVFNLTVFQGATCMNKILMRFFANVKAISKELYPQLEHPSDRCMPSPVIQESGRAVPQQLPKSELFHPQLYKIDFEERERYLLLQSFIFTSIRLDICLYLISLAVNPTSALALTLDSELSKGIHKCIPVIMLRIFFHYNYQPYTLSLLFRVCVFELFISIFVTISFF